VLAELIGYMSSKQLPAKQKAMMRVLKHVAADMIDELGQDDVDHDKLGSYFANMGSIIAWIGDGDSSKLPDSMREFLEARAEGMPVLAIEAEAPGVVDIPPDGINPEFSTADSTTG
jgi:hypothetical protein